MFRYLMGRTFHPCFDAAGGGSGAGAGAGAAGAGAGAGAGGAAGGGSGAGAGGGGTAGAGAGGGAGKTEPFATFPDEATFMARMKREGKSQMEAMAKELGFDSVDAFKTAAKAKKDADEASKTELEKEKARADTAEANSKAALGKANQRLINAEIKLVAQTAGFVDPADAVALIDRSGIAIDDKESVTGVKEAIEALKKAKPHLVGTGKPGGSPGGTGNGNRQDGSGGSDGTEFATNLAKKRAEQNKAAGDHQNHYFKQN